MDQGHEGAPIMAAPAPGLRRSSRAAGAAVALPAAGTVARVHSAGSIWTSRRTRAIAAAAIVIGTGYLVATMLTTGAADTSGQPWSASAQGQEGGGLPGMLGGSDRNPAALIDLDDRARDTESSDSDNADESDTDKSDTDKSDSDRASLDPGADSGSTDPGTSNPGTNPGTTDPGTSPPTNPGTTPTNPGTTPTNPGTTPTNPTNPTTPTTPTNPPTSTPSPPAPAPKPLAFAGLQENYTLNLLGIKLIGSYTLSLTGQPGATASVTYGSNDVGAVKFDSSGRASIKIGSSLVDLKLSNPLIRVAYSDGTAGSAIEARRDSI